MQDLRLKMAKSLQLIISLGHEQKNNPRQKQTQKIMFHTSQCSGEFSTEIVEKKFIF